MNREYEFERYCATVESVEKTLEEFGVAILPSVLDENETKHMREGMWGYLEHITQKFPTPIHRENPQSWKSLKHLYPHHSMLIQHWGIGHAQMLWNLRQNEKIINVFSKIHKTEPEDLLVSFDGASFHFPPEITGIGWFGRALNLHTDQSYLRNDKECIQGWVSANPVEEGDATLTVLEGSHKVHADFAKHFNVKDKANWYKLSQEQKEFYLERGCKQKFISCPEGSLVLWDSRTIHCGIQPAKGRAQPKIRCIGYVCYTPRKLATKKDLEKKVQAFKDLRTTSHWPHKPKLFARVPRTYGGALPEVVPVEPPVITELGKRLIGF